MRGRKTKIEELEIRIDRLNERCDELVQNTARLTVLIDMLRGNLSKEETTNKKESNLEAMDILYEWQYGKTVERAE